MQPYPGYPLQLTFHYWPSATTQSFRMERTATGRDSLQGEETEQEYYQHSSQNTETYPKPAITILFHLLKASCQGFIMASINSDKDITYKICDI